MRLYHGSNLAIPEPQVFASDRKLDFGPGFYLTSSLEQAERWARKTAERRKKGNPVVSVYEFDESNLSELKIQRFEGPTRKWLNYVAGNRSGDNARDNYDIVIGPVANDQTMPAIRLFLTKVYTASETIRRLLPQKLKDQYTFKTDKSLQMLTFVEAIEYES